ncbi:preprotein translocase subunit [Streptococcus varani]|uniref:Preprotein translocase subunit n=1 Tax=Streptococcus varani TaxID=1608583 RepID=A0A0E4H668_9STRE|nr:preprotein translocase subunit YajC [Streptococcus varani]CQR25924.1 preprotein translocase subunit [Streptococcus varani]
MGQFIFPVLMLGMLGWMFFSQRKQQQSRANTLNQIKKGDEIVTIGGLYGIVDEINDQKVVLDIDGIYLTFDRAAIRNRVTEAAVTPEVETIVEESTEKSESAIEE